MSSNVAPAGQPHDDPTCARTTPITQPSNTRWRITDPLRKRILQALEMTPELGADELADQLAASEDAIACRLLALWGDGLVASQWAGPDLVYRLTGFRPCYLVDDGRCHDQRGAGFSMKGRPTTPD